MKKIAIGALLACSILSPRLIYGVGELHRAICGNDLTDVQAQVALYPQRLVERSEDGRTPLLCAVSFFIVPTPHLLVVDHDKMQQCMRLAFEVDVYESAREIFVAAAETELDINGNDIARYMWTFRSLWTRARIIKSLLKAGADIAAVDKWGHTVFHFVARGLPLCLVRFVLDQPGAAAVLRTPEGLPVVNEDGQTVIHAAITWGRCDLIKLFHSVGISLTTEDKARRTPFGACASEWFKRNC